MKILYAVQATGNGHISRAMEILPHLKKYGEVDLFLSGSNSHLQIDAPIKYRSKGIGLFYNGNGGLQYLDTAKAIQPRRILNEIKSLPVEKYDLVLNDFESITALACMYKKVSSLHFGHQASFISKNTPRPIKKSMVGELILKYYARATIQVGLHFEPYDTNILPPIIKTEICQAQPNNLGHITVYLLSYNNKTLLQYLAPLKDYRFEVFSKEVTHNTQVGNVLFLPVEKDRFNNSLLNCDGIIAGAGFETPAEALYLHKKLLVIPISGQYEQHCNAAALQLLGVTVAQQLDDNFTSLFYQFITNKQAITLPYTNSTEHIIQTMMSKAYQLIDNKIIAEPTPFAL